MRLFVVVSVLPVLLAACGPTCQSTCYRYMAAEECDVKPEAIDLDVALEGCVEQCERAMGIPGPVPRATDPRFTPKVDPINYSGDDALTNAEEAAAWMDCVFSFTDRDECHVALDKQACATVL